MLWRRGTWLGPEKGAEKDSTAPHPHWPSSKGTGKTQCSSCKELNSVNNHASLEVYSSPEPPSETRSLVSYEDLSRELTQTHLDSCLKEWWVCKQEPWAIVLVWFVTQHRYLLQISGEGGPAVPPGAEIFIPLNISWRTPMTTTDPYLTPHTAHKNQLQLD